MQGESGGCRDFDLFYICGCSASSHGHRPSDSACIECAGGTASSPSQAKGYVRRARNLWFSGANSCWAPTPLCRSMPSCGFLPSRSLSAPGFPGDSQRGHIPDTQPLAERVLETFFVAKSQAQQEAFCDSLTTSSTPLNLARAR